MQHGPKKRPRELPTGGSPVTAGFTLVELLVVIAVIAILAAMLLPGLSRAKAAGQSAACKSNLHQIGVALQLYTGEFGKYPVAAISETVAGRASYVLWDARLLPFASNNRDLFRCPANLTAPRWTNSPSLPRPNQSYGYNMAGTGRYPATGPSLGLDGGYDNRNGNAAYVGEQQVRTPSDLVAVIDVKPKSGGEDNDLDDLFPINVLAELAPARHNYGANAVFCDNHVEFGKLEHWLRKSDLARQRWNVDHQPHRETWGNNP